jgi:hypothetical protein
MNVVVIRGTGLNGSMLVAKLDKHGHEASSRHPTRAWTPSPAKIYPQAHTPCKPMTVQKENRCGRIPASRVDPIGADNAK